MDADVDALLDQRLLDFLHEQRLAAEVGERRLREAVARRSDDDDFGLEAKSREAIGDARRLRERQPASARPEPQSHRSSRGLPGRPSPALSPNNSEISSIQG